MTALETRLEMILPMLADIQKATTENTAALAGSTAALAELRADMHKMNAEMRSWTLTTMIAVVGTVLAAVFGISQIYKGSVPAVAFTQPAPIIITIPGTYTPPAPSAPAK